MNTHETYQWLCNRYPNIWTMFVMEDEADWFFDELLEFRAFQVDYEHKQITYYDRGN
jgi:hypothetical protein